MACSSRFNGRPGHARWPRWPTNCLRKHCTIWEALVASTSPQPSWQVALALILLKRWCSGASPATHLQPIELSSSDVSSFTPESKAYQIGMRHACTCNTNRCHKHGKPRAYRNGVRFAPRRILHVIAWGLLRRNTPHAMTCSMRRSVRSRLNLQMRPRCLQQQTSQGQRDLLVLCCGGCVIDCWHLQKQECQKMNASLRTEKLIMVSR